MKKQFITFTILVVLLCSCAPDYKTSSRAEGKLCIIQLKKDLYGYPKGKEFAYNDGFVYCLPDFNVKKCENGRFIPLYLEGSAGIPATCLNTERKWSYDIISNCCCTSTMCYQKGTVDEKNYQGNKCIQEFKLSDDCDPDEDIRPIYDYQTNENSIPIPATG